MSSPVIVLAQRLGEKGGMPPSKYEFDKRYWAIENLMKEFESSSPEYQELNTQLTILMEMWQER